MRLLDKNPKTSDRPLYNLKKFQELWVFEKLLNYLRLPSVLSNLPEIYTNLEEILTLLLEHIADHNNP